MNSFKHFHSSKCWVEQEIINMSNFKRVLKNLLQDHSQRTPSFFKTMVPFLGFPAKSSKPCILIGLAVSLQTQESLNR